MSRIELPDLSRARYCGIDTETTGLDYKDRPVGLSFASRGRGSGYAAWGHPEGMGNNCSIDDVQEWVTETERANPDLIWVFFNANFDLRMMAYKGVFFKNRVEDAAVVCALINDLEPSFTLDDLCTKYLGEGKNDQELNDWCARAFGGQATRKSQAKNYCKAPVSLVGPYATDDAEKTLMLYEKRHPLLAAEDMLDVYEVEVAQIPLLLKMHLIGVRVSLEKAQVAQMRFADIEMESWEKWKYITGGVNPGSPKQMATLFDRFGIAYPRTELGNPSFESDYLKTVDHDIARLCITLRSVRHYKNTFIGSYIMDNVDSNDVIHGEFHSVKNDRYGTVSGRYSSGGALNLQNIPKRDKILGPLIRGLYIPYFDGQEWTRFDYSQIEYRFLAHYAGGSLMEAYLKDPDADFHQALADLVGIERDPAKTMNFAVVYGQGDEATAAQLKKDLETARAFLKQYHDGAPEIKSIYNDAMNAARSRGYIVTWGGRRRRFAPSTKYHGKFDRTHKALNALLQGSAADLIKYAMAEVAKIIDWEDCLLHLTVHDELDFSTTPGEVGDRYRRQIKECLEEVAVSHNPLRIPIRSECEVGPDWGHLVKWAA